MILIESRSAHPDGRPQKTPDLPVTVFAVIAEHLIGQHAFKTAANLNLVCKAVHLETLSILFESFFFDEYDTTQAGRVGDIPEAAKKYTKYVPSSPRGHH